MTSWKLTAYAPKPVIHALLAHDEVWDWDPDLVIPGSEVAEDRPDDRSGGLVSGKAGQDAEARRRQPVCRQGSKIRIEKLPDADWLVLSQQEVEPDPRRAFPGPNPEFPPSPAAVNSVIPRSPAIRN